MILCCLVSAVCPAFNKFAFSINKHKTWDIKTNKDRIWNMSATVFIYALI